MIPAAEFIQLAEACARPVPAATLLAVARTESSLHPWALSVNRPRALARTAGVDGLAQLARQPRTQAEAIRWAKQLVARGIPVSLGLLQVSSEHLTRFNVTIEAAFEPCTNLKLGALVLSYHYREALGQGGASNVPLADALSRYNTGNASLGHRNGYVGRVFDAIR
jgi:type IV secretion system protein VirB1